MIAIGFLFVRVLCDCFKSRRRLEAEVLVLRGELLKLGIDVAQSTVSIYMVPRPGGPLQT